jgi:CubicO group peptidase (beta-lactamase class C family)
MRTGTLLRDAARVRPAWLSVLCLIPGLASATSWEAPLTAEVAAIFTPWDQPDTPGAAVAVAHQGQIMHGQGFGLASLEFAVPISPETAFNAGSVAKQFTATAVLVLEAEGRLRLDDPVRRYVPELPDIAARITLRQMLNHTSGLRDIWALTDLAGWMPADVRTTQQALRLLARQRALNFPPGTSFSYSNSGYLLLAEVVARVTNQSFPHWTREHLFTPLEMTDTYFYADHSRILPRAARSYRSLGRGRGFAMDTLNSGLAGGGNLVTTTTDLARWAHHVLTAEVGAEPLLARLTEQPTLPGGFKSGYGLGLFAGTYKGLPVIHHGGASAGYRSHLLIFVEEKLAFIVLGNVNTVRADQLARRVADQVLSDRFAPTNAPVQQREPKFPTEAYAGLYALGAELLLDVREAQGKLYFLLGGTSPRALHATGGHTFAAAEPGVSINFAPGETGAIAVAELRVPGRTLSGKRLEPFILTAARARRYEGRYFSEELQTYYDVVWDSDGLLVRRLRGEDIQLRPISPNRFLDATIGDLSVRFSQRRSGRIDALTVSVDRARNLRFDKQ